MIVCRGIPYSVWRLSVLLVICLFIHVDFANAFGVQLCTFSVRSLCTNTDTRPTSTEVVSDIFRRRKERFMNDHSPPLHNHRHLMSSRSEEIKSNSRFRLDLYLSAQAIIIGVLGGLLVSLFKFSIDVVKRTCLSNSRMARSKFLIPTIGGLIVGLFSLCGNPAFSPGLKGTMQQAENDEDDEGDQRIQTNMKTSFQFIRKFIAAVVTLGTGCSLGPEGPSVEIGMGMSQLCMNAVPVRYRFYNETSAIEQTVLSKRKRLLLSCGAAAGVSAGFEAPLSAVFFALEIAQASISRRFSQLSSSSRNLGAILLSSVIASLVTRSLLGTHLALVLSDYNLRSPLKELPLYVLLGATTGCAAFLFNESMKISNSLFNSKLGPTKFRNIMKNFPKALKPAVGGLLCGLVGLVFPQILFNGYETLNSLLANTSLPTSLLISLLFVKMAMTSLSAGSGLVGGVFAPSLFLGAMVGGSFHNTMVSLFALLGSSRIGSSFSSVIQPLLFQLADVPAYAMVGAGAFLSSMFRAPLTGSLLIFELTRDYDVILPLMVAAGVGTMIRDTIEAKVNGKAKK